MPGVPAIVTTEGRSNDRSALATVRALAVAGHQPVVAMSGPASLAGASRFAARTVVVPPSSSSDFVGAVSSTAGEIGAVTTFATSDASLTALYPETSRLMDKASLSDQATALGIATPLSRSFDSAEQLSMIAAELGFPIMVKPRKKVPGGPAAMRIETAEGVRHVAVTAGVAQPYIDGVTRAVAGVAWGGGLVAVLQQRYLRTYPMEAGTASYAVTEPVDPDRRDRLERLLGDHHGIFQAQFVDDLLIDLNLRPYGSMPLALAAGLNLPDMVIRLVQGNEVAGGPAQLGVRYRWLDGDLRSLRAEVRSGRRSLGSALAATLPRPGTCHSIAALSDLRPMLVRLRRSTAGRP